MFPKHLGYYLWNWYDSKLVFKKVSFFVHTIIPFVQMKVNEVFFMGWGWVVNFYSDFFQNMTLEENEDWNNMKSKLYNIEVDFIKLISYLFQS